MLTPLADLRLCFNGAATFQLRIVHVATNHYVVGCRLQWSRNFSVADCRNPTARLHPRPYRFNGAATIQLRIDEDDEDDENNTIGFNGAATIQLRIVIAPKLKQFITDASMEPQLFSCGLP